MRKFITILILLMYAISIPGVTMATHFCMNMEMEMEATLGYDNLPQDCTLCHQTDHPQKQKSDCCQNDHQFIKTTSDQDFSVPNFSIQAPIFIIERFSPSEILARRIVNFSLTTNRMYLPDIPIYKQVQSFRI